MAAQVAFRIQRQRTKGWRMPENTVYVGRPSKWGNPFIVERSGAVWRVISTLQRDIDSDQSTRPIIATGDSEREASEKAITIFRSALVEGDLGFWSSNVKEDLHGANLACWCPIGSPCHADVLLAIANGGTQ